MYFSINGHHNIKTTSVATLPSLKLIPHKKSDFISKYKRVIDELNRSNTYLLNLTFSTQIETNLNLIDIFKISDAPYKFCKKDAFVSFSPECFVKIQDQKIYTYPMKGTIDASLKNAETLLINNQKEIWEHNTIVDLMRNDLAMVASDICVEKYRTVKKITAHTGGLLQTISTLRGKLPADWKNHLGEIILTLLPAGSISGAPKPKTVEIIKNTEEQPRDYYTGIFGIFDGQRLDSGVAIRFIENKNGKQYFRSGGGITSQSHPENEYKEVFQKIYIPIKYDFPLFETLCIKDGCLQNISWHQKRFEKAYFSFYGIMPVYPLLPPTNNIPKSYQKGLCKMKVS